MTTEQIIQHQKDLIVALARTQIGAHYLRRGHGHIPSVSNSSTADIYPGVTQNYVYYRDNQPNSSPPIMFAARSMMHHVEYVCGGRNHYWADPTLPPGGTRRERLNAYLSDPHRLNHPHGHLWPRPFENIGDPGTVWGECCLGKRHFDCVGFVNWCFWKVLGRSRVLGNHRINVEQWQNSGLTNRTPVPRNELQPADILIRGTHHIGIYAGNGTVIEAKGRDFGVVSSSLGTWDYYGRPHRHLFDASFPVEVVTASP